VFGFIVFSLSGLLEPGRLLMVLLGGWWVMAGLVLRVLLGDLGSFG
jgi:hypothetical protein